MSEAGSGARGPELSVVVATHDRPRRLRMLIEALSEQSVDGDRFEVVVVDDASGPETRTVLVDAVARGGLDLKVLRNETSVGPAGARDRGWRAAGAAIIAFTDDDCLPRADWVEAAVSAARSSPDAIVQGRTEPIPEERDRLGPFTRTIEVSALDAGFQTCNIIYPRRLLELIDGFDTAAFDRSPGGEDADLAWRAIGSGAEARFDDTVVVAHAVNELGPVGKLRVAARWTTPMQAYARHPGLRDAHFHKRIFWKGSHYLLIRALLALALPRRLRWLAPWLAVPYLQEIEERRRAENAPPAVLGYYVIHDLVECWAIGRAAVRYRHPMI